MLVHFDSAAHTQSRFSLHGHTTTDVQGPVFRVVAEGPYNLELVRAHLRLLTAAGAHLPADGRFIELHEYRRSLLMPLEAWERVTAYVDKAVENGVCALATIIVLGSDVEGQELFAKGVERVWSRSRPVYRVQTMQEGEALLRRLLAEHGLIDTEA